MSSSLNEKRLLVFDIGSRFVKSGFVGDALPRSVVSISSEGINHDFEEYKLPPYFMLNNHSLTNDQYNDIVNAFLEDRVMSDLSDIFVRERKHRIAIRGERFNSFDELTVKKKLNYIVKNKLLVSTYRIKAFLIDDGIGIQNKYRILDFFLNELKVKSVIILPAPVLSTIASNVSNGIIINFGWEALSIHPVVDLRILEGNSSESFSHMTGLCLHYKFVEEFLKLDKPEIRRILEKPDSFHLIENFILNAIYVRPNGGEYDKVEVDSSFEFIPGVEIPNRLRFQVIEDVFFSNDSISSTVKNILDSCSIDTRNPLKSNVIVTGGLSNIPGFKSRLLNELSISLKDSSFKLKKCLGSWVGCSLYVSNILLNQKKDVWKQLEIDKDKFSSLCIADLTY